MQIERLPQGQTEKPFLYGAYDHEKKIVKWLLDSPDIWDRADMTDGTNWFQVWHVKNEIHVQATQWYHEYGNFKLQVTDLEPDQAVALAEQAAYTANDFIDGGAELKDMP